MTEKQKIKLLKKLLHKKGMLRSDIEKKFPDEDIFLMQIEKDSLIMCNDMASDAYGKINPDANDFIFISDNGINYLNQLKLESFRQSGPVVLSIISIIIALTALVVSVISIIK